MPENQDLHAAYQKAANRLHHLSMRYSGALVELVANQPVGMLAKDHPGLSQCRDFIDLILYTRAEISGLTALLVKAGVLSLEDVYRQFTEEYEFIAKAKAEFLGVGLTDHGITFSVGPKTQGDN